MSFGQQSGPPASGKQIQELLDLLLAAGHADFRDARGPMGFTQRQAGGKFTRDEARDFIEQLEAATETGPGESSSFAGSSAVSGARRGPQPSAERTLRGISDELLAAELQRRGWIVVEP